MNLTKENIMSNSYLSLKKKQKKTQIQCTLLHGKKNVQWFDEQDN